MIGWKRYVMGALLSALSVTEVACLVGCAKDASIEQKMAVFQQVSKFARDNDMAGSVSLTLGGDGAVYAKQSFGLDTDVTVQATLLFNSGDAE